MSVLSADVNPISNNPIKNYCFTLFYESLPVLPASLPDGCGYLVFQRELCPETKREHLQGYVQLSSKLRFRAAKEFIRSLFPSTERLSPFIAIARGTPSDNRTYCTKSESRVPDTDPFEFGELSLPGARNDLKHVRAALLSGVTPSSAFKSDDSFVAPSLRYYRSWKSIMGDLTHHRDSAIDPIVVVHYGASGTGKTKSAFAAYPDAYVRPTGKWWDLYDGQQVVIYDDFDGSDCTFSQFKTWVDRYPCLVEPKGGSTKLQATTHIITTNVYPSHWWSKRVTGTHGRDAIWRRITAIVYYPAIGEEPITYNEPALFRALEENDYLESLDPKHKSD